MSEKLERAKWRPIAISNPSTRLRMKLAAAPPLNGHQKHISSKPETVKRSSVPMQLSTSLRNVNCDPDYEIIDFSGHHTLNSTSGNQSHQKLQLAKNTMICALCGGQNLFASCKTCAQNFCEDCDNMNHKHPKRHNHIRQRIVHYNQQPGPLLLPSLPPLPPKNDVQGQPPVPPPRRHRKSTQMRSTVDHRVGRCLNDRLNTSDSKIVSPQNQPRFHDRNASALSGQLVSPPNPMESGIHKMLTLQDRYRKYQDTMRTHNVNRRQIVATEIGKEPQYPRDMNHNMVRSRFDFPPPHMPVRSNKQSLSVCDLSSKRSQTPELHQAQSIAHWTHGNFQRMRNSPEDLWNTSINNSTMSLNHPRTWVHSIKRKPSIPPLHHSGTSSSTRSSDNYKSQRGEAILSCSKQKGRKSSISQSRSRLPSDSTSNASSEGSNNSEFEYSESKSLRNSRRRIDSHGKTYQDRSRQSLSRNRYGKWRSETNINGVSATKNCDWDDIDGRSISSQYCYGKDSNPKSSRRNSLHMNPKSSNRKAHKYSTVRQNSETEDEYDLSDTNSNQLSYVPSRKNSQTSEDHKKSHRMVRSTRENGKNYRNNNYQDFEKTSAAYDSDYKTRFRSTRRETMDSSKNGFECIRKRSRSMSTHINNMNDESLGLTIHNTSQVTNIPRNLEEKKKQSSEVSLHNIKTSLPKVETHSTRNEKWSCEHCTFLNEGKKTICVICCKTKRSALPVTPPQHTSSADNSETEIQCKEDLLRISNSSEESEDIQSTKTIGRTKEKYIFTSGKKITSQQ